MAGLPLPAQILVDNANRLGRIRPGPQHLLGAVSIGVGALRDHLKTPGEGSGAMASAIAASRKPRRLEIHDLSADDDGRSGEGPAYITTQFNPTKLEEVWSTVWDEVGVTGLSHERQSFRVSKSVPLDFELFFDALEAVPGEAGKMKPRGTEGLQVARKFLQSLTTPVTSTNSVQTAPPRVLLVWEGFMVVKGSVREIRFSYERWAPTGELLQFKAHINFKEILDARRSSRDVREGSRR